jgi:hypothetical protein
MDDRESYRSGSDAPPPPAAWKPEAADLHALPPPGPDIERATSGEWRTGELEADPCPPCRCRPLLFLAFLLAGLGQLVGGHVDVMWTPAGIARLGTLEVAIAGVLLTVAAVMALQALIELGAGVRTDTARLMAGEGREEGGGFELDADRPEFEGRSPARTD